MLPSRFNNLNEKIILLSLIFCFISCAQFESKKKDVKNLLKNDNQICMENAIETLKTLFESKIPEDDDLRYKKNLQFISQLKSVDLSNCDKDFNIRFLDIITVFEVGVEKGVAGENVDELLQDFENSVDELKKYCELKGVKLE
jgi:hypothetical protein